MQTLTLNETPTASFDQLVEAYDREATSSVQSQELKLFKSVRQRAASSYGHIDLGKEEALSAGEWTASYLSESLGIARLLSEKIGSLQVELTETLSRKLRDDLVNLISSTSTMFVNELLLSTRYELTEENWNLLYAQSAALAKTLVNNQLLKTLVDQSNNLSLFYQQQNELFAQISSNIARILESSEEDDSVKWNSETPVETGHTTVWKEAESAYQHAELKPGSFAEFVQVIHQTDWHLASAEAFKQAVDMAMSLGAPKLARELANLGLERYPSDEQLARAAYVLAPAKVVRTLPASGQGLAATMAWIKEHAAKYRGLWIAVEGGQLLGSAPSRKELIEQLGNTATMQTLVTRIP